MSFQLETRALAVGHSSVPVASGLDLTVGAGEVVALLGRNGAGKTTTLHTLAGILAPMSGDVLLSGRPATGSLHRRARSGLALVTEDRAVIRRLTVAENLRLGRGRPSDGLTLFPELEPLRNRKAGLLSGGEQQMLVLARVLASRPTLLLVDELSFGLAPLVVDRLLKALRDAANAGTGVLLVEQHAAMALSIADRGYVLGHGKIELAGSGTQLEHRLEEIERSYLSGAATQVSA